MEHWVNGTLGYWNTGLLEHWVNGTLGYWNTGLLEHWFNGTLGYWNTELMEHWATGTLGYWNTWVNGTLDYWNTGLLEYWASQAPRTIGKYGCGTSVIKWDVKRLGFQNINPWCQTVKSKDWQNNWVTSHLNRVNNRLQTAIIRGLSNSPVVRVRVRPSYLCLLNVPKVSSCCLAILPKCRLNEPLTNSVTITAQLIQS